MMYMIKTICPGFFFVLGLLIPVVLSSAGIDVIPAGYVTSYSAGSSFNLWLTACPSGDVNMVLTKTTNISDNRNITIELGISKWTITADNGTSSTPAPANALLCDWPLLFWWNFSAPNIIEIGEGYNSTIVLSLVFQEAFDVKHVHISSPTTEVRVLLNYAPCPPNFEWQWTLSKCYLIRMNGLGRHEAQTYCTNNSATLLQSQTPEELQALALRLAVAEENSYWTDAIKVPNGTNDYFIWQSTGGIVPTALIFPTGGNWNCMTAKLDGIHSTVFMWINCVAKKSFICNTNATVQSMETVASMVETVASTLWLTTTEEMKNITTIQSKPSTTITTESFSFSITAEDAPGAVIIGVTGLAFVIAFITLLFIMDCSSFPKQIRICKRNTQRFRKWLNVRKDQFRNRYTRSGNTRVTTV